MQPTCRYSDDRDASAQCLTFDHRPRVAAATLAVKKMNLKELSEVELYLLDQVKQVRGLMEEMPSMIDNLGVFDKYIAIHKSYADLADKDTEALKRALFIQWYAISEPSCYTGIPGGQGPFDGNKELDREAEVKVIRLIEEQIKNHQLDKELQWMLSYYGTWDYYFEQFTEIDNIMDYIKREENPRLDKASLINYDNRGQLGVYWKSILNNYKNH